MLCRLLWTFYCGPEVGKHWDVCARALHYHFLNLKDKSLRAKRGKHQLQSTMLTSRYLSKGDLGSEGENALADAPRRNIGSRRRKSNNDALCKNAMLTSLDLDNRL
ncbi:hypothetical protein C2G38_2043633 [Gigaspora rosea]|uniref:Uncharacterized protein n=1 Tax=Gigaspora rosea TaxID=44941 RepID=A0A397UJG8_9GLOM|nr:hypothetical protein C2G38_2043631 [Gigaspora rosea]RIB10274.1 hypothetical protein C2G38_2043633 [Gigaspora rosea]